MIKRTVFILKAIMIMVIGMIWIAIMSLPILIYATIFYIKSGKDCTDNMIKLFFLPIHKLIN